MFKLLRYFSLASAVAMLLAAAAFVLLYRSDQINELVRRTAEEKAGVAAAFSDSFWPQFRPLVEMLPRFNAGALRRRGEIRAIGFALDTLISGTPLLSIRMATPGGRIFYASHPEEIGTTEPRADQLRRVVAKGEPVSRLDEHDGLPAVETVAPLAGRGGAVEGVMITLSDVSGPMARVEDRVLRLTAILAATFVGLYAVLFLIVHRADRIIRRQRRSLEDSEARFRSVTQSAADAIVSADGDGRIVSWNDGARAIFGYDEAEVLGHPVALLVPERYRPAHEAGLRRLVETGRSMLIGQPVEYEGLRRDGSEFPLELSLSKWSLDGRPHFTAIIRDITDRHEAERNLHATLDELTRSNAELEHFAYIASHDLQEPVRSVTSFAQLLQRRYAGQLDRDADEYIGFIVGSAQRMGDLVRDLLAYSRVSSRTRPFSRVEMGVVVDGARENLQAAILEAGAAIVCDPLPAVTGDSVQLTQLLQNLIGNGIKFHKPGEAPEIRISASRRDGDWLFAVADNGIGIEPAYREQIFIIFKRLHGIRHYPGTGIGLAVAKRIVERHGGRIWVESQPERGSTFFFTLPAAGDQP